MVKISNKFDFFRKFRQNFGQNFEKFRFQSNFGQNFRNFRKIPILLKFSKNFDFSQILLKISILVKNFENLDFSQIFEKISILIVDNNCDFVQKFRKFRKIPILLKFSKNFDFSQIFEKISILDKFSTNLHVGKNFQF